MTEILELIEKIQQRQISMQQLASILKKLMLKIPSHVIDETIRSTTSSSYATIGSLTIPITIPDGHSVVLIATPQVSVGDSTTQGRLKFTRNSTDVLEEPIFVDEAIGTHGVNRSVPFVATDINPGAGTYNYNLQWRRWSGSGTIYSRYSSFIAFSGVTN